MTDQVMKGRAKTADRDALLARITPSADYADLKDVRPHRRGGVRGSQGEGRGDRQGRGGHPPRRDLRLEHLDAADLRPRQDLEAPGRFHRHPLLLAGRADDAGRDHHGQGDRRQGARRGARLCPRHQEDADRRQRRPRLLRQPLRRRLHPRRPPDADRGRAGGDDRERRPHGRHAGRAAVAQRRGRDRPRR